MPAILSKIFNKNTLVLFGWLAIAYTFYTFWHYANDKATNMVTQTKADLSHRQNQDKMTVEDYSLKEVNDANKVKWQLHAKSGVVDPVTKDVSLETVHVDYYDEAGALKMRMTAPTGIANENTKMTKLLSSKTQKVECEGEGGKAKLLAYQVELKNKNQFLATGGVNIVWPGVAKVNGSQAEGSLKNTDLKNFKIVGNTHAWIGGSQ